MDLDRYKAPRSGDTPPLPIALGVAGLVIAALYFGSDLFVPLALAILLSFVLTPLVVLLRKIRVPRGPAVILVVALAFSIIAFLGMIMGSQLAQLAERLPSYESTLRERIRSLQARSNAPAGIIERTTEALEDLSKELEKQPDGAGRQRETSTGQAPIPVEIHRPPPRALEYYQSVVEPLIDPLARAGLVLILVIFILLQREDLRDRVIRLFGGEDFERTTNAINDAARRLSRLFLTLTAMNFIYGAVMAGALWLIGIPSPILWGILAGLMRYVPYVGSIIAAVFPVLLAAAIDPGWSIIAMTLVLYVVGEFTMGQVLEPWLLGSSTGLAPLAVITSAVFWTWLWGPIGLLLAVPLTVCLIVLGRHVPQLSFLYILLGDQPALTPAQRFYQRLLADDLDEITFDAERFIREKPVLCYLDDVMLPGLVMAQIDVRKERLGPDRLEAMRELIIELIGELSDAETPPQADEVCDDGDMFDLPVLTPDQLRQDWRVAAPVLAIGVRNALDEAAAAALAHAAIEHGVGTRVIGPEEVSPGRINDLDIQYAKLAVLSHLEAAQAPAHARALMRRLKRKNPDLQIVIGAWDENLAEAEEQPAAAQYTDVGWQRATTLRQALKSILEAAQQAPRLQRAQTPEDASDSAAAPEFESEISEAHPRSA